MHLARLLADLLLLETLKFTKKVAKFRAVSSVGRAPALQAGRRGFESLTAHRFQELGDKGFPKSSPKPNHKHLIK